MTRPILAVPKGFDPPVVEKVERLLEMLDAIANNPYLRSRLILHGGTALNVFHADMPRLSVDIDLAYVGSAAVEGMLDERPRVDGEVRALAAKLGYAARSLHNEHSGQSYRLRYDADSIKVDVSYLARVPLLEPAMLTCSRYQPTVVFATLQLPELVAGKVSALVDRTAPRDLYDIARLATAEVLAKKKARSDGDALITTYRQRYSRYSAFQGELRRALRGSTLLAVG